MPARLLQIKTAPPAQAANGAAAAVPVAERFLVGPATIFEASLSGNLMPANFGALRAGQRVLIQSEGAQAMRVRIVGSQRNLYRGRGMGGFGYPAGTYRQHAMRPSAMAVATPVRTRRGQRRQAAPHGPSREIVRGKRDRAITLVRLNRSRPEFAAGRAAGRSRQRARKSCALAPNPRFVLSLYQSAVGRRADVIELGSHAATIDRHCRKMWPSLTRKGNLSRARPGCSRARDACPLDCPDTCSLNVTIEQGRVTKLDGSHVNAVTAGYICGKVRHFPELVYGTDRCRYPAVRSGPKGSGQFRRATWDEALEIIVERLQSIRARMVARRSCRCHTVVRTAG